MNLLVVRDKAGEAKEDVPVAIRVRGCPDQPECQFALTHVYWS